jgi:hypothetical protein
MVHQLAGRIHHQTIGVACVPSDGRDVAKRAASAHRDGFAWSLAPAGGSASETETSTMTVWFVGETRESFVLLIGGLRDARHARV